MKTAFTMLELVLVMMILAILAFIALPKFNFSLQESKALALKADFALLQSALANYKNEYFLNKAKQIKVLDEANINAENEALFYCSIAQINACNGLECCNASLLQSPIYSNKKSWLKTGKRTYAFSLGKENVEFEFKPDTQSLECTKNCKLIQ